MIQRDDPTGDGNLSYDASVYPMALPADLAAAILSARLGYIVTADDVQRVKAQP